MCATSTPAIGKHYEASTLALCPSLINTGGVLTTWFRHSPQPQQLLTWIWAWPPTEPWPASDSVRRGAMYSSGFKPFAKFRLQLENQASTTSIKRYRSAHIFLFSTFHFACIICFIFWRTAYIVMLLGFVFFAGERGLCKVISHTLWVE